MASAAANSGLIQRIRNWCWSQWMRIPYQWRPHVKRFGLSGLVVSFVIATMMWGLNPVTLFTGQESPPPPPTSLDPLEITDPSDAELLEYVTRVYDENEAIWKTIFRLNGKGYPQLRIFALDADSAGVCGVQRPGVGTFYCPQSLTLYVDLQDFARQRAALGEAADLGYLYMMAFEYTHHVQNTLGIFATLADLRETADAQEIADFERAIVLQSHCYAGLWAAVQVQPRELILGDVGATLNVMQRPSPTLASAELFIPKQLTEVSLAERRAWFEAGHDLPASATCSIDTVTQSMGSA